MLKTIIKSTAVFCIFLFIAGISAFLTISYSIKNESIIVVPELVGRDVVSVLEQLSDMRLNTKVAGFEYTTSIPKNFVISQDPEPGTLIKEGRDVRIIFSKGPRSVIMPSLSKLDYQSAGLLLDDTGLEEGNLSYTFNSDIPKNHIISQFPFTGSEILRGDCADLLISKGKKLKEYIMSDLTGFSIDDAIFHIENANLVIGEIKSVASNHYPENTITAHEPGSGHRVTEGKRINIVINRAVGNNRKKYSHDAGPRLFRYRVDNGFLKKHMRAMLSSNGQMNEVFDDYVRPGDFIWVMVPYNTEATVFLYEDNDLIKTRFYQ